MMYERMKRTTISLPDELAILLERESKRLETSISDVVRTALQEHLGLTDAKRKLPFVALGKSGQRHTAKDAEKLLSKEWKHAGRR